MQNVGPSELKSVGLLILDWLVQLASPEDKVNICSLVKKGLKTPLKNLEGLNKGR